MNKKTLLIIISILTIISIIVILILNYKTKYNKFIINNTKWNEIINSRNKSTNISLKSIEFNDYNLLIDENNSIIYYSVVDTTSKYNPLIRYKTNQKTKFVINSNITDKLLEKTDSIKIMIYNDSEYRIYTLVVTKYPILNITYDKKENDKKIDIKLEIFDNYIASPTRIFKSTGKLKILKEDEEYILSLKKESLGHNERENHISIFGMEKQDEYLIKTTKNMNKEEKYVQLFINNEYKGLYTFGHNKERRNDNFEKKDR